MKRILLAVCVAAPLFAEVKQLSLTQALEMLKKENLELKIAKFDAQMKALEAKAVEGMNYGKADLTLMGMRSNDAGNVFGFKLQSREATFADFGFSDFMGAIGQGAAQSGGDFGRFTQGLSQNGDAILGIAPHDLNYPKARNHFQTKLSYMLPLYTGGKLTEYGRISKMMYKMSLLDCKKTLNMKIYETRKAFYDITLVENYIINLRRILANINKLEGIIREMKKEGYAKNIDLLEVEARRAEAESMYNQAKLNRELAYQYLSFLLNTEVSSIKRVRDVAPMPKIDRDALAYTNLDIRKAKLGLEMSKHAMELEKSRFLPEVGAFAEYGSADNNLWNDFTQKDAYTVGVQMKWNLFSGGSDEYQLEKAKVNYMKVREQVALAKKGIALKVKKLRTEILSIDADIRSYTKQLRFAKEVYRSYSERYKEGLVSISDVLIKQSKELEMLLKLLTAKNKRNTKVFQLESILNRGEQV
ncbi:Type I secretion system, outer membrane component LapE [hydrothermal vent metagenome]|uniref:Type I secretion system, outer membrane component LapE n=1 Tax=hydrothermal vent metagenome TaxID=652676 RepID=A0A1W1E9V0_9ZZZZ